MKLAWITDPHFDLARDPRGAEVLGKSAAKTADAALITGDIAESDKFELHLGAFAETFRKPVYFLLGNHDRWRTSFAGAEEMARRVAAATTNLVYLPDEKTGVDLGCNTVLAGVDGFYDARAGSPNDRSDFLNDWMRIGDFMPGGYTMSRTDLVECLQKRGREAAALARVQIEATKAAHLDAKLLILATHVPPFTESTLAAAMVSNRIARPAWYTNVSLGMELAGLAEDGPLRYLVLAGHVHGASDLQINNNLRAMTGSAVYGKSFVAKVIKLKRGGWLA